MARPVVHALAILWRWPQGSGVRYLYTLAMYLVTPLMLLRLLARGMRSQPYRRRWPERFGIFTPPGFHGSLWVHAVSVGEVNAAAPLIRALRADYANAPLVITTVTPTGSARVHQLFGRSVFHVYLPYDLPFAVERFLRQVHPRLALIVETEIWPNLYFACHQRGIPLMIVNARLSRRSLRGYRPLRALARSALRCVRLIAAQSRSDAARYRLLGADPQQIMVTGNMKFDMTIPVNAMAEGASMRASWGAQRPVWIAASTHEGEELAVLDAHRRVLQQLPDAVDHPQQQPAPDLRRAQPPRLPTEQRQHRRRRDGEAHGQEIRHRHAPDHVLDQHEGRAPHGGHRDEAERGQRGEAAVGDGHREGGRAVRRAS